jgi:hypothetical protein
VYNLTILLIHQFFLNKIDFATVKETVIKDKAGDKQEIKDLTPINKE